MKTCPTCQRSYSDELESCPHDGAGLAAVARDERECPYCAELILKKACVCKHCGHDVEPLVGTGIEVQTPSPASPQRITGAQNAQPEGRKPAATASRPPTTAKPPWLRSAREPLGKMKFVAIGVVALMLIVAGAWYFLQRGPKKGEVRVNPKDGLKYVWIAPGTFQMGCSPGDTECGNDEKPTHQVSITKGFWLGQAEVTVGAYKRFAAATARQMPPEPNYFGRLLNPVWGNEAMPIVNVTWDGAQAYCAWVGGRLPTEAEWEYATRAGRTASRYADLDEIAWDADNSGRQRLDGKRINDEGESDFNKRKAENGNNMHEVGQKRANGFGLYDMLGNVWEWVNDWYGEKYYQSSPTQDPAGPTSGTLRVVRGGSWFDHSSVARASDRFGYDPSTTYFHLGFRCVGEVFAPLKAAPAEAEEVRIQKEAALVQDSINKHKDFDVCRIQELEFVRAPSVDAGNCSLPFPYCGNVSTGKYRSALKLLDAARYIGYEGHPTTYQVSTDNYWWTPTDRGVSAIGNEIKQERAGSYTDGRTLYKWTLILGCRELQQLDATTQLSDGLKVDFSWHWKVTNLGTVDGLSGQRERGVAYFTRTANGLVIDQIEVK